MKVWQVTRSQSNPCWTHEYDSDDINSQLACPNRLFVHLDDAKAYVDAQVLEDRTDRDLPPVPELNEDEGMGPDELAAFEWHKSLDGKLWTKLDYELNVCYDVWYVEADS